MSQRLLGSGQQTAKNLLTFGNFIKALGVISLITLGIFRILVYAGFDIFTAVKPQIEEASAELRNFQPGAPRVEFQVGEKTYTLFEGMDPGADWETIMGPSSGGSGGGSGNEGDSGGGKSPPVGELPTPEPPEGETDEQKQERYDKYKRDFISLVGGAEAPDFGSLEASDVVPARTLLAAMKSVGISVAEPAQWEAQLEEQVRKRFEECFPARSLGCVRDWNDLQTKIVSDPPGLRDWVRDLVRSGNNSDLSDLVSAASNTNAAAMVQGELKSAFDAAKLERRIKACKAVSENSFSALDLQWCFLGMTVSIRVTEPAGQLPPAVGGNRGVLDPNDTIEISFSGSESGEGTITIPYKIAVDAIPGLDVDTTSHTFPEEPTLWDGKWNPGEPLP